MDSDKFKISEENMRGKGVSAQSNPMELPEAEAKAVFDQLVKEVVVPKFNEVLEALEPINLTSDAEKPISLATQAALDLKVDKEKKTGSTTENKVLSDNNYSDSEKTKLSGVADHANNYVHPATHDASMITGLANLAHNVVDGNNTGAVRTVGAKSDYTMGQFAFAECVNTVASGIYSHVEDKKQIASDVAKQQAMDLGFNLGFSGLQAAGKTFKGTAANKDLRNLQNATSANGKKSMPEARNILKDIQTDAPQNTTILRGNRAINAPMDQNVSGDTVVSIGGIKVRKEDLHDVNAMRLASSTQERNMESIISNLEVAKRMNQEFIEPIHPAEQRRQFFIKDTTDKIKKLNIDTKKKYQIKDANRQTHELTESGLVQYLGEKRHQLQMLKKTGKEGGQNLKRINNLKFEISLAENALPKEQLKKINKDIQVFQEIDKSIHQEVNEVLIRNGYNPIRYKEGSLLGIFFNDATMRKEIQKLGIDFPFLTENSFKSTSPKTEYNALKTMDQYLEDTSTLIYHTDNINNLRKLTDEFEYAYSPDFIKAKADAIKTNHVLSNQEKWDMLDGLYEPYR